MDPTALRRRAVETCRSEQGSSRRRPSSIHPLRQVVAALELGEHLRGGHGGELRQVLGVLPLEELHAVLRHRLAAEVAVGGGLLVLRLTEGQGLSNGARATVK